MTPQYGYPFVLKQLKGNIRICQGCRGTLRLPDGTIPSPPYDIVISHMERRPFKDTSGTVRTPTRPSAAHYHLKIMCVRIADPVKFTSYSTRHCNSSHCCTQAAFITTTAVAYY